MTYFYLFGTLNTERRHGFTDTVQWLWSADTGFRSLGALSHQSYSTSSGRFRPPTPATSTTLLSSVCSKHALSRTEGYHTLCSQCSLGRNPVCAPYGRQGITRLISSVDRAGPLNGGYILGRQHRDPPAMDLTNSSKQITLS